MVAECQQVATQQLDIRTSTYRQGADNSYQAAYHRDHPSRPAAWGVQFFREESRSNLMHRDGRGERGKYQQGIEHHGYEVTHERHACESLLEHVRQGDEDQ